jgi:hypothetical protein
MWSIERIEITGGFLPGLKIQIPLGLTCIIGAHASGSMPDCRQLHFQSVRVGEVDPVAGARAQGF